MAVEVLESDSGIPLVNGTEATKAEETGKVSITFGSHGVDEPAKVEVDKVSDSNLPKDVVDEWPEPQQTYSFYFPRYRPIEDQKVKAKLEFAEKELQNKNQARGKILDKLKAKRAERANVTAQIRSLIDESKQFRTILGEKRKQIEPLKQASRVIRGGGGGRERGPALCSSEEELNAVIKSCEYRIQHESNTITEEKQILREIKQLQGTREKVIANAAEIARLKESYGEKEAIDEQVNLIGAGLDGVRKENQVIQGRIKELDEEKLAAEKVIDALEEELKAVTEKRDQTFDSIRNLRKQREEGNTPFYENRNLLTKAKMIASDKDIEALEELLDTEFNKFISPWNTEKAFRTEYEKRILQSLDMRQFSRDARIRNSNEKPLIVVEAPIPSQQPQAVMKTPHVKQPPPKEETNDAAASEKKVEKAKSDKNVKDETKKTVLPLEVTNEDKEEFVITEKPKKKDEVDEKKLKELKREEEKAKRILAEERKKKVAEKAAIKAAIVAQKEAEKKLKEREKRARKKSGAGAVVETEEPTETIVEEEVETENVEEKIQTPTPVPQRSKGHSVRTRAGRTRGPDSLPKAILKRKKATNYWMWAAPAAAMTTLVFVMIGYNYLI